MKKLLSILVIAGLLAAGTAMYQRRRMEAVQETLANTVEDMGQTYGQLASETAAQMQQAQLSAAQKNMLEKANAAYQLFKESTPLQERIAYIGTMQQSLAQFVASVDANQQSIQNTEAFAYISQQMSERSTVRPVLQSYNDLIMRWNMYKKSTIGSLLEKVHSSYGTNLPFLRFDGEQRSVNLIEL